MSLIYANAEKKSANGTGGKFNIQAGFWQLFKPLGRPIWLFLRHISETQKKGAA